MVVVIPPIVLRLPPGAANVRADLKQLEKLRRYIVLEWKSGERPEKLNDAIDDCAEMLTGERAALHEKSGSIG